jgi:restriction system protein
MEISMAVPDYQSLMFPVLADLGDGRERPLRDVRDTVAAKLGLTAEELALLVPSGRQTLFANRANWAHIYLKEAGLLRTVRRGVYQITDAGRESLRSCGGEIDIAYLKQFPAFLEFMARSNASQGTNASAKNSNEGSAAIEQETLTPDEQAREGYRRARSGVAAELLERMQRVSPAFFEQLVVDLLVAMDYGGSHMDAAASVTGGSGDGGIDGVIKEDKLGLESIYVQAKRWKETSTVGRPDIQQFAGALQGKKARKGVFITTSSFTKEAKDYANAVQASIVLIDGPQLAELMLDHGVGVSVQETIKLFKIDEDYFIEE